MPAINFPGLGVPVLHSLRLIQTLQAFDYNKFLNKRSRLDSIPTFYTLLDLIPTFLRINSTPLQAYLLWEYMRVKKRYLFMPWDHNNFITNISVLLINITRIEIIKKFFIATPKYTALFILYLLKYF